MAGCRFPPPPELESEPDRSVPIHSSDEPYRAEAAVPAAGRFATRDSGRPAVAAGCRQQAAEGCREQAGLAAPQPEFRPPGSTPEQGAPRGSSRDERSFSGFHAYKSTLPGFDAILTTYCYLRRPRSVDSAGIGRMECRSTSADTERRNKLTDTTRRAFPFTSARIPSTPQSGP